MDYEIDKYLRSKDSKRYGTCKRCGIKVYWTRQKVKSHLRSGNCIENEHRALLLSIKSINKTILSPVVTQERMKAEETLSENETEPRHQAMTQFKLKDYINILQQFVYLPLFEKKQFLRNRAPEMFIKIIRESLRNVRRGVVPCDESLTRQCNDSYSCHRIDGKSVSHREARNHLCEPRTLGLLIRVLPFVLKYLHSLSY